MSIILFHRFTLSRPPLLSLVAMSAEIGEKSDNTGCGENQPEGHPLSLTMLAVLASCNNNRAYPSAPASTG